MWTTQLSFQGQHCIILSEIWSICEYNQDQEMSLSQSMITSRSDFLKMLLGNTVAVTEMSNAK